jgi:N-acetylmuramic acid 6-phosphate etherase
MAQQRTEEASERYHGIDTWPSLDVLAAIHSAQRAAIEAVGEALPALAAAAEKAATLIRDGGRLVYAGAGSSGLLAQLDALEIPGTYGIPADRLPVLIAGGRAALVEIPSGAEDDAPGAERDVEALDVSAADALLAISASGRTPYAVAALRRARLHGATTIGMASNSGTPLLEEADHAILIATPPEVIAGSTRMNAGTAQKCALNMLSTLIGIRLGHVYDAMMVNVVADNDKLRRRAAEIVARASRAEAATVLRALEAAGGEVKLAILLCAGAADPGDARAILESRGGDVRASLAELGARRRKAG